MHTPAIIQKKGVLDKRVFQPKQRARLLHFFANPDSTEVARSQYSGLGVSRGPDCPLPTQTETASATRKAHTTAHNSLSRGLDNPTFFRIDTVSILQKARIRRAVQPFSIRKPPQQYRRHTKFGRENKGTTSHPCSSQMYRRSFRPTRGRVSVRHVLGFVMGSRAVENDETVRYNNGTQKTKTRK